MLWTIFIAARDGDAVVVPAGTDHDLVNMSNTALLKLYTIYSPLILHRIIRTEQYMKPNLRLQNHR
jgi:mannose-6-phosphate isomerase-like protein (cupin superfamily)